jgi:hypothetical protein
VAFFEITSITKSRVTLKLCGFAPLREKISLRVRVIPNSKYHFPQRRKAAKQTISGFIKSSGEKCWAKRSKIREL